MDDWEKSGKISSQAREYGKTLCVEGAKYLDIVEGIENKMRELGAEPAFPADVSVNSMAAHDTCDRGDERTLKKGDLVKIDLGAHINGCVTDTAMTIEVGTKQHGELIKASREALNAAIEVIQPNVEIWKIGDAIERAIESFGFKSIRNLSGHGVGPYQVHTPPSIPNYNNKDKKTLADGQHIAIEPFATDGVGLIKDGKVTPVYRFLTKRPVRVASTRKVLEHIESKYRLLPFSPRWLEFQNLQFHLNSLIKIGAIKQYTMLPEKAGGLVSQAEHTVRVGQGVLTK